MAVLNSLLPQLPALIVFLGMFALVWRSLSIAHDLSKLALEKPAPQPVPPAGPIPAPAPKPAEPDKPATEGPVIDQGLIDAVKKFEGFSAKAYGDYKQFSIGYGTRAKSQNEVIDQAEAERRLKVELGRAAASVEAFCPEAPKGVKQALTDLTYNVGPVWQHNDLGKLINARSYEDAKAHVLQYNHAGGQVNEGLTKRRQAEVGWFEHPL